MMNLISLPDANNVKEINAIDGGVSAIRKGAKSICVSYEFSFVAHWDKNFSTDLPEELKINQTLETLYLAGGNFPFGCIECYANALEVNKTLKLLGFLDCTLYTMDLYSLVEALKKNKTLTTLVLSNNGITNSEIKVIADLIRNNQTLKEIQIIDNKGHLENKKSKEAIIDALEVNTTLTDFVYGDKLNCFDSDERNKVEKYLVRNRALAADIATDRKVTNDILTTFADVLEERKVSINNLGASVKGIDVCSMYKEFTQKSTESEEHDPLARKFNFFSKPI